MNTIEPFFPNCSILFENWANAELAQSHHTRATFLTFVIRGELHGDERIEIFCAFGKKFIPPPVLQYQLIEKTCKIG
jgi:hypothetical protein